MHEHKRVLMIAQPALGRRVEHYLRAAGWSVYRSPDTSLIAEMVRSVNPRLLIVGLDAPWFDQETLAKLLAATECDVPVLALSNVPPVPGTEQAIFLPVTIEPQQLLSEMVKAIASNTRCCLQIDQADHAGPNRVNGSDDLKRKQLDHDTCGSEPKRDANDGCIL